MQALELNANNNLIIIALSIGACLIPCGHRPTFINHILITIWQRLPSAFSSFLRSRKENLWNQIFVVGDLQIEIEKHQMNFHLSHKMICHLFLYSLLNTSLFSQLSGTFRHIAIAFSAVRQKQLNTYHLPCPNTIIHCTTPFHQKTMWKLKVSPNPIAYFALASPRAFIYCYFHKWNFVTCSQRGIVLR